MVPCPTCGAQGGWPRPLLVDARAGLGRGARHTRRWQLELLLTRSRYAPNRVRKVVGHEQRAAAIDGHPDRATASHAVLTDESVQEIDRRTGRAALAERHKDHLVARGCRAVPAAMLADKYAISKLVSHARGRERNAKRRDMGAQGVIGAGGRCDLLRILRLDPRIDVLTS